MDATKTAENLTGAGQTSSDELKSEIDITRQRMDDTINELGERLRPRRILDEVVDYVRSRPGRSHTLTRDAQRAGRVLARCVRDHPIPSALIGAGITWWIVENRRSSTMGRYGRYRSEAMGELNEANEGYSAGYGSSEWAPEVGEYGSERPSKLAAAGEAISSTASNVASKVSGAAQTVGGAISGTAQSVASKVSGTARSVKDSALHGARNVRERTGQLVGKVRTGYRQGTDEYPLGMALGFLALGMLAGLALPRSDREDRLMGEASSRVKETTKSAAGDLAHRASEKLNKGLAAGTQAIAGKPGGESKGPGPQGGPGNPGQPGNAPPPGPPAIPSAPTPAPVI